jgi:hypothetical protein
MVTLLLDKELGYIKMVMQLMRFEKSKTILQVIIKKLREVNTVPDNGTF